MGEVYRAHDDTLDRDVAIKALPPEFAHDPDRLARLRREARTLASLNHPNIAAIHELVEWPDLPFLVLELVEGDALHGPLPLAAALDRAGQVAEALEAAHERGIVHRDLKPANLKVTRAGAGEGSGLRPREGRLGAGRAAGTRTRPQRHGCWQHGRTHRRHTRVHEPRAGSRRAGGSAHRHLGFRMPVVRVARRQARLRGRHPLRRHGRGARRRARLAGAAGRYAGGDSSPAAAVS